ncbi:hypothetical protein [Micromonospora sp. 4G55]|uniref:hypothetical protein n=1 Tax=Micromonospora sp. 4G55 TaxID=2806102 RepID=UPI001A5AE587|nr:hypothetical protein [Micromonospora sp. 4G55]MBM0255643.1 hypothetical protein [Micromonospora sp. 4G55]
MVSGSWLGLLMLWLLARRPRPEQRLAITVAALLPLLRYGPFNLTLAVPRTSPSRRAPALSGY